MPSTTTANRQQKGSKTVAKRPHETGPKEAQLRSVFPLIKKGEDTLIKGFQECIKKAGTLAAWSRINTKGGNNDSTGSKTAQQGES
jgi:hypothetical protein